jgi:hypothetical protein
LIVTNHFRTGLRMDPADARVRATTTTLARFARLEEQLSRAAAPDPRTERGRVAAQTAVSILRDRRGPGDAPLPLGDRRALDALIATHSVVADATAGVLYVSEGPHTLGRYVRFDLAELLRGAPPARAPVAESLPADPLLGDPARIARARARDPGRVGVAR